MSDKKPRCPVCKSPRVFTVECDKGVWCLFDEDGICCEVFGTSPPMHDAIGRAIAHAVGVGSEIKLNGLEVRQ